MIGAALSLLRNPFAAAMGAAGAAGCAVWLWLTVGSVWPAKERIAALTDELVAERQVSASRATSIAVLEAATADQNAKVQRLADRCTREAASGTAAALRALNRQKPVAPADVSGWNRWLRQER